MIRSAKRELSRFSPGSLAWLAALLAICAPASRGSAAEPLTLDRALEIARQRNPDLLAARLELEIARGPLVKAESLSQFNPELSGDGARRSLGAGGSGVDYGVALSQELEVAGGQTRRAGVKLAREPTEDPKRPINERTYA